MSTPDGNGWLFQEVTTWLAGRIDSAATSFASANDLASAFRNGGKRDEDWPEWYAAYRVAEQSGKELPK
jgi:hypothetical protein